MTPSFPKIRVSGHTGAVQEPTRQQGVKVRSALTLVHAVPKYAGRPRDLSRPHAQHDGVWSDAPDTWYSHDMHRRTRFGKSRGSSSAEANAEVQRKLELLSAALEAPVVGEMLETDIGTMLVHADDEVMTPWIRHYHGWEAEETAFFRATLRPGDVLVDCGANFGWFSVLGSSLVGESGRVIAIEPEAANLALLRANLWVHGSDNVEVVAAAAGAHRGLVELRLDMSNRGNHQTHALTGAKLIANSRLVPIVPLDELLAGSRVDLVKIDVQGYDHEVFAGLSETIAGNPGIVLLVEFWLTGLQERGLDASEVLNLYRAGGFDVAVLLPDGTPRRCTDSDVFETIERLGIGLVNLILLKP
jgi:FkbM family methyltransferase